MKEIKELNKQRKREIPRSWTGRLNVVEILYVLDVIYRFKLFCGY
jgi:hypothetical protein